MAGQPQGRADQTVRDIATNLETKHGISIEGVPAELRGIPVITVPPAYAAYCDYGTHVSIVIDQQLRLIAANASGRRFLCLPNGEVAGVELFNALSLPFGEAAHWHDCLSASYDQLKATRQPVVLLLSASDTATLHSTGDGSPGLGKLASGKGLWHVGHTPVFDEDGELVAIVTDALRLDHLASAFTARVSGGQAEASDARAAANGVSIAGQPAPGTGTAPGHSVEVAPEIGSINAIPEAGSVDADSGSGSAQLTAGSLRILLVEDNEDLRSLTQEQLQLLGHQVHSAPDAEQALRQLASGRFDLLFTDLSLPKMTGAELARHVLQQERPMRVVITSGYGRAMANAQNLDALFLPKPYRFTDLQAVLREVVSRQA